MSGVTRSVRTPARYTDATAVSLLYQPALRVVRAMLDIEKWKVTRVILRDVTLSFKPKQMTLVLGQPGCGGTALLRVLSGRDGYQGGRIAVCDDAPPKPKRWAAVVAHVASDDMQFPVLTVRQTMDFACAMQLPRDATEMTRIDYRDTLLRVLGIDHRIDTFVGGELLRGLSGGERRRLSIAVGLAKVAPFYTVDEPTTGLDAGTALRVTKVLREIADGGPPVVAVLRQPSIELVSLFDQVVVLAVGRVAFAGSIGDALTHFYSLGYAMPAEMNNPAEFLANVVEHPELFAVDEKQTLHSVDDFVRVYEESPFFDAQCAGYDRMMDHRKRIERAVARSVQKKLKLDPDMPLWKKLFGSAKTKLDSLRAGYIVNGHPVDYYSENFDDTTLLPIGDAENDNENDETTSDFSSDDNYGFEPKSETSHTSTSNWNHNMSQDQNPEPQQSNYSALISKINSLPIFSMIGRVMGFMKAGRPQTSLGLADAYEFEGSPPAAMTTQIKLNVARALQLMVMAKSALIVKVMVAVIFGVLLGTLFFGLEDDQEGSRTKVSFIFFTVLFFGLAAVDEVDVVFQERRIVIQQVEGRQYSPVPYMIGVAVRDIPLVFLMTGVFCPLAYFMANMSLMDTGWRFVMFTLTVSILSFANSGLIRFFAFLSPTLALANSLASLTVFVEAIFSGFMVKWVEIPWYLVWLYFCNPGSYAFATAMINEFSGETVTCLGDQLSPPDGVPLIYMPYPLGFQGNQRCFPGSGNELLEDWGLPTAYGNVFAYFFAVVVWWILMQVLTYIVLAYIPRSPTVVSTRTPEPVFNVYRAARSTAARLWRKITPRQLRALLVGSPPPWLQRCPVPPPPPAIIEFSGLQYSVKGKRRMLVGPKRKLTLLRNVMGYVEPGMMLALMGVTGAGKSTLLDVLARRKTGGKIEGSVLLNGRPLPRNFHRYYGYCEQSDIHFGDQTVREAVRFSALMRLDTGDSCGYSIMKRLHFADWVLQELKLTEIQHRRVGWGAGDGITAEQRKRLTLAVEVVANPSLLFLDEPTSGLDSYGARMVMEQVRHMCDQGRSVVCTIHQPPQDILAMFTHVLLLAPGGRMMFFGAIHDDKYAKDFGPLLRYLESVGRPCPRGINPGDALLQLNVSDNDIIAELDEAAEADGDKLATRSESGDDEIEERLMLARSQSMARAMTLSLSKSMKPADDEETGDPLAHLHRSGALRRSQSALMQSTGSMPVATEPDESESIAEEVVDEQVPRTPVEFETHFYRSGLFAAFTKRWARRREEDDDVVIEQQGMYSVGKVLQIVLMLLREYIMLYRHPSALRDRVLLAVQFALVLGLLFLRMEFDVSSFGPRLSLLFLALIYSVLAASPIVGAVIFARPIVFREQQSGFYSESSYVAVALFWDLPVVWAVSGLFGTVLYWMTNLGDDAANFFYFMAIILLTAVVTTSMTRLCAFLGANLAAAMAIMNLLLTIALLFAGFYQSRKEMGWPYLLVHYVSFGTYSLSGLVVNGFTGRDFVCDEQASVTVRIDSIRTKEWCPDLSGDAFLDVLGFEEAELWIAPLVLVAYSFIFLIASALILRFVKHIKR